MRKRIYNVITPLNRFENLRKLIPMLEPHGIKWHVIMDQDVPFRLTFRQPWIECYVCPNHRIEFWNRCNGAINWFLDSYLPTPGERYQFLNDDDCIQSGFFDLVDKHDSDVVITSMKRGHRIPPEAPFERAHGFDTLVACPANIRIGGVGVEQIIMSGEIIKGVRIPYEISGDGRMVMWTVATYGAEYCPEAFIEFNKLEPNRWNNPA